MDFKDYNQERATVIDDGSFSILSILPIGLTPKDDIQFLRNVKNVCISVSREYAFVRRIRECSVGYTSRKSENLKHCACFDIVDSFVGEKSSFFVPSGKKTKNSATICYKKRNACMRMYIGTTYTRWCDMVIRIDMFLKLIMQKNVGIICFNLSLDGLSVERTIALKHVVESKNCTDNAFGVNHFRRAQMKRQSIHNL